MDLLKDLAIGLALFVLGCALCAWVLLAQRAGLPLVHDEVAYIFQARMFAMGHLSLPSPPMPEFFEAAHILVVPRLMAKYFPGHALLLAPFAHAPWRLPILELGASTALLYVAARAMQLGRIASIAGALAFACSGPNLAASGTYFSQTTSTFCAAAGLAGAALLRSTGRTRWAVLFAAAAGLALLTRPFDGLALAAAGVAMPRAWNRKSIFAAAAVLGASCFLLLAFCKATTGSWTKTPWSLYAREYMPWDGPGIGKAAAPPPERAAPAHLQRMVTLFEQSRERYTWRVIPFYAWARAKALMSYLPGPGAAALLLLGLLCARMSVPFAYVVALFLLQLSFHFMRSWYLQELYPPLALAIAAGADLLVRRAISARAGAPRIAWASGAGLGLVLLAAGCARDAVEAKPLLPVLVDPMTFTHERLAPARAAHGLVFVQYRSFGELPISNDEPDFARAPALLVLDLGPEKDAELRKLFPDRPAFLYDVPRGELVRLP